MVVTASLLVLLLFAGCASFGWGLESEAGSRLAVAPVSSSSSTLGSFDDNGLYKIAIERSRVEPDAGLQEKGRGVIIMRNRRGHPFQCLIPQVVKSMDDRDALDGLNTITVEAVLEPRESNRACLQLVTSGWWHYELCFHKHVVQYHMEKGIIVGPVVQLGLFSHSFDWSNVTAKDALKARDRYHSQYFINGSECDLTGRRREVHVKFFCESGNWATDYIESVREPQSCSYQLIVYTRRLCNINYFKKVQPQVGEIVCNPLKAVKSEERVDTVDDDQRDKLGRSLIDTLLKEEADDYQDIDVIVGESDADVAIKNELQDAADKINEKLFENAKFFVEKEGSEKRIGKPRTFPRSTNQGAADPERPTVPTPFERYVDQARKRSLSQGEHWVTGQEVRAAILAIDFKQMGRLSSAEKDVMERMFQVIKLFQRLDVDDQEKRSAAFDTVQNEYAHMAVLIMVGLDISERFKEAFKEVFVLVGSIMGQYTREREHFSGGMEKEMQDYPADEKKDGLDEIVITEEMLEDGMKIAEAIRKLDFISIGPLGEAEQELFEHLLVVSEEIMQAMRRTDDMSAVTAAELVEDFKADLLTIRSKMVESKQVRNVFRHKMNQFLWLKMALLNHVLLPDMSQDAPTPTPAPTRLHDIQQDPGDVGDQSTRDGSGVGKRKRHGIVEEVDEEEDGLSKEEKHVTSLLMKAFGKTSVITDQDNSIPPTERLESVRQAHLLMKDVRTILLDPNQNVQNKFRAEMLEKVQSAIVSLKNYERTAQSLEEIRDARLNLQQTKDYAAWSNRYGRTVQKAREVDAANKAARAKLQPRGSKGDPRKKLLSKSPAKSRAPTLHDILADIADPERRKMKEVEDIIRNSLSEATMAPGFKIKLIKMGDAPAVGVNLDKVEMAQLQGIKKNLAGVLANHIQGVLQQQIVIHQLEDNYDIQEDNDDDDGVSSFLQL